MRLSASPWFNFLYNWLPEDGPLISIIFFLTCYFGYISHSLAFLLALNRFTAVLFPFNHEQVHFFDFFFDKIRDIDLGKMLKIRLSLHIVLSDNFLMAIFGYESG